MEYVRLMKKRYWQRPTNIRNTLERFMQRNSNAEKVQLVRLWQHWSMVMGPDIANLAKPLGEKNFILLIGTEDAMSTQEISFMHWEILERANAFMGKDYFTSIKVGICLDKTPLDILCRQRPVPSPPTLPPFKLHCHYLQNMSMDSAVARCYARFVQKSKLSEHSFDLQ